MGERGAPGRIDAAADAGGSYDASLVQETRQEIRVLVQEIAQLAQSEVPAAEFSSAFLTRVVSALASAGGAIWTIDSQGAPELAYQIKLADSGL
jgi:hypothetical protein